MNINQPVENSKKIEVFRLQSTDGTGIYRIDDPLCRELGKLASYAGLPTPVTDGIRFDLFKAKFGHTPLFASLSIDTALIWIDFLKDTKEQLLLLKELSAIGVVLAVYELESKKKELVTGYSGLQCVIPRTACLKNKLYITELDQYPIKETKFKDRLSVEQLTNLKRLIASR